MLAMSLTPNEMRRAHAWLAAGGKRGSLRGLAYDQMPGESKAAKVAAVLKDELTPDETAELVQLFGAGATDEGETAPNSGPPAASQKRPRSGGEAVRMPLASDHKVTPVSMASCSSSASRSHSRRWPNTWSSDGDHLARDGRNHAPRASTSWRAIVTRGLLPGILATMQTENATALGAFRLLHSKKSARIFVGA